MTDVRLVATNPEDSTLVPVATNNRGELAVQYPKIEKLPNDLEVVGDLDVTGSATFASTLQVGGDPFPGTSTGFSAYSDGSIVISATDTMGSIFIGYTTGTNVPTSNIFANGSADFDGEVTIGSRGSKWLIRESNGVAMLIEQTRRGAKEPRIEEVRDLPRELDLVEAALNEIMGKLKMTPPAGWPVWDGSDNSQ